MLIANTILMPIHPAQLWAGLTLPRLNLSACTHPFINISTIMLGVIAFCFDQVLAASMAEMGYEDH